MGAARAGRLAVAVSLLLLLASGCTSPPSAPKPSPTPVVSTSVENAQAREQRVAYEGVEKSYREFRGEYDNLGFSVHSRSSSRRSRANSFSVTPSTDTTGQIVTLTSRRTVVMRLLCGGDTKLSSIEAVEQARLTGVPLAQLPHLLPEPGGGATPAGQRL